MKLKKIASALLLVASCATFCLYGTFAILFINENSMVAEKIMHIYREINLDFFTASGICMIIFATSIVCHLFSYDGEKTDKGFELFYNNLSDRRKFIRLLWLSPAYILLIILIFCVLEITIYYKIAMALFFTGVYAAGVFHAYRTYKKSGK